VISFLKLDSQKNSIAFLDGVRAIACLVIVWYHVNLATRGPADLSDRLAIWSRDGVGQLTEQVMYAGWCGVTLFFVLSGFLLFLPYVKALLFDARWPSLKQFYLRRAFRIWPAYYISLVLLILLTNTTYLQPQHWKETLLFLTFFMDSAPNTYEHLNGPFWTLAVEWQFYLFLPLFAWGIRFLVQRGTLQRRLWVLSLCLLGLAIWGVGTRYIFWSYGWAPGPHTPLVPQPWQDIAMFFLYGRNGKYLEDFAVGMFLSMCYVLAQNTTVEHRLIAFYRRFSLWFWGAGILWLFAACIWPLSPFATQLFPFIGSHRWLADFIFAVGFGLCVLALLFGPQSLRRVLEWMPLRWIGALSFSMYIWHLPILRWLFPFFSSLTPTWPHPLLYLFVLFFELAVVTLFCYLFYCAIEQPWMRLSNRLLKKPKKAVVAAT
jgi:peptidoglycan/LPS O-acetylase OafA/YrhL